MARLSVYPLFGILVVFFLQAVDSAATCGYESCNAVKEGMINVHLVPHTHDDVGWLKTVDQYFYGDKSDIQRAGVQYILDAVIPELIKDPNKRFIYVEMAFFARWWRQQGDSMRHTVKRLVNQGQLEFILGGWCMNDEASTHYNAIIDQHTLGFEFLRHNFGDCGRPRVAWQIDPFGHSREQASLFAQMGFDGLFFGRLDYQDKFVRAISKTMEMVWKGSPSNLKKTSDLFTGALFRGYGPPKGFCFDLLCSDDPIMDDDRMQDYNVPQKVEMFVNASKEWALAYATKHVLMPMGSDFNYQSANAWFKNLDKLIKHVNKQSNTSKVNVLYSTPSCYLSSLNKAGIRWPTKEDDFFPYAHRAHSFWTGYFSSRPALKEYVRRTNNFLQVCKQMDAIAMLRDTDNSTYEIQILKEAMGVAQHHDAVSGTEKQPVAYDYAQRLARGVAECQKVVNDAFGKLSPFNTSVSPPGQQFCNSLNISVCGLTENYKQFTLTVYNPLGQAVTSWVRIPVVGKAYEVKGHDDSSVPSQVIPLTKDTKRIPERQGSIAQNELVFKTSVPALGFSVYFIKKSNKARVKFAQTTSKKRLIKNKEGTDTVLKNEHVSLTFDGTNGRLKRMRNLNSDIEIGLQQGFYCYQGHTGNNTEDIFQASGAYVFRPNSTKAFKSKQFEKSYVREGRVVQEVHQTFSPWVTQVIRLYEGEMHAEFEWTVGPIPIADGVGKEVASAFLSTLDTKGSFYTDANGREILKRQRNERATWLLKQTEPIAGNFYPVNSRIYVKDEALGIQLTVLTDRSQGGSSIIDGGIQLMVHRRLLYDDGLGVGEPLNETGLDHKGLVVRGKHYVFLGGFEESAAFHRKMALRLYMAPSLSFIPYVMKYTNWTKYFQTQWSGINYTLPANVHLLTLEQWGGPGAVPSSSQPYIIRLEHIFENGEHSQLSKDATVNLQGLFVTFTVDSVTELTLGANMALSDLHRLQWNTTDVNMNDAPVLPTDQTDSLVVKLTPMQIRTYQVQIKSRT
ncbi:lysosomal alpha-mannosidase-like [Mizuhopecten yessoensis]|uniref:Alpha-mannosidase n=1 Tax=Mizuhopecten yessoensis TaxID=6573 RepID=A0A210QAB9_MIZYE|nr:lysosomal alpha-mannosidase-like [Mizuhopecten yessoensis]OWF45655.1 Lysosomal alpha-mannosidase [Mizuhopecten yessoensis]